MAFVHRATVRFADVDRAGVVFFARIFSLCHVAWEELWAELSAPLSLEESFAAGHWQAPVVHAEADFLAPLRLGDRVRLTLRLAAMGQRSVALACDVDCAISGAARARVSLTLALLAGGDELKEQLAVRLGPPR